MKLLVLKSNAGYYIGTTTEDGYPYSRESEEYYNTKSEAEVALATHTFTQRNNY
jgi:hypothetical protein